MFKELDRNLNIKQANTKRILDYIRNNSEVSKQDIMMTLQLSLPTITQNLEYMEAQNVIVRSGKIKKTGGRNAVAYSLNSCGKIALGMDITKHHVSCVALSLDGSLLGSVRKRIAFQKNREYYKALADIVDELIGVCKIEDQSSVLGVGIGVPALTSVDGQHITYGKILDFTDESCDNIAEFIPFKCRMYNDANAAGYAEMWFNKNLNNAFYLCLGNNIGGSVILGKQVYMGDNMRSGEIGHTTLKVHGGKPCFCGQKGCFETYCAATVLSDHTDGQLDVFFDKLAAGDEACGRIFEEYLEYLAVAINNLRMLFDCDIIVGGYIGTYIDRYMPRLCELIEERNMFKLVPGDSVESFLKSCMHKVEAIACGAALPLVDQYFESLY